VPCPKYTKVVRNGIVVEMEVIHVVVCGEVPNARPIVKPLPRIVETATCGKMVRETKSARRADAEKQFSLPSPKRTKVIRDAVKTTSLGKRMAEELDALHALLRKAEHLSTSGKIGRVTAAAKPLSAEAPAEASTKTPPAKRTKVCTPAKIVEFESAEDKNEFVDICGGVSPAVPVEKAGESGNSPCHCRSSSSSDSEARLRAIQIQTATLTAMPRRLSTSQFHRRSLPRRTKHLCSQRRNRHRRWCRVRKQRNTPLPT
jgi:hypothetical protein